MNCYMYLTTLGYTPPHPHAINGCDNSPVHARETTSSDLPDTPDTYLATPTGGTRQLHPRHSSQSHTLYPTPHHERSQHGH